MMRSQPPFPENFLALAPSSPVSRVPAAYRNLLRQGADSPDRRDLTGRWDPNPDLSPEDLLDRVEAAQRAPARRIFKSAPESEVFLAEMEQQPVVIKRRRYPATLRTARYRRTGSRARRAWAGGLVLDRIGLPVAAPLGFLERREGGRLHTCWNFAAFLPGAASGRKWIKPLYHRQPEAIREQVRHTVAGQFLALYRHHIYHADTKALNFLLRHPGDPAGTDFFWIDLECVRFGVPPSRRRVLRNLAQLNGSIGAKVSDEDRRAFLEDLAVDFPWLLKPAVFDHIRRTTLKRLHRELHEGITP